MFARSVRSAAHYLRPNPRDIADKVAEVLDDKKLRQTLIENGRKQSKSILGAIWPKKRSSVINQSSNTPLEIHMHALKLLSLLPATARAACPSLKLSKSACCRLATGDGRYVVRKLHHWRHHRYFLCGFARFEQLKKYYSAMQSWRYLDARGKTNYWRA